jgi:hypothetical protein
MWHNGHAAVRVAIFVVTASDTDQFKSGRFEEFDEFRTVHLLNTHYSVYGQDGFFASDNPLHLATRVRMNAPQVANWQRQCYSLIQIRLACRPVALSRR